MINIVICEDDNYQRDQIELIIKNKINNLNSNFNIALSTKDPDKVIKYIEKYRDNTFLCFLDIELKSKINGMELAKIIRKFNPMGYIVFITSHVELTLLTFEYKVQAMEYIVKNDFCSMKNKIIDCINEVYNDVKNTLAVKKNFIKINVANRSIYFNLDEILFFETSGNDHKIKVHTCDEQLEFYGTLKEIQKIASPDYYKVHRSYLINTKKIKCIDKSNLIIHMINDETCYISERHLKGLLEKCTI